MVVGVVVVVVVVVAAPGLVLMVSFSKLHPIFHVTDANTPMTTTKVRNDAECRPIFVRNPPSARANTP